MRDPYEVLGLKPGASKDEIAKRYNSLFKRNMAMKAQGMDETAQKEFDEITHAYEALMGYSDQEESPNEEPNVLLKKLNVDEKKVTNFWYYNKFKVLTAIGALLVVGVLIWQMATNVKPDFMVKAIGEYKISNFTALEDTIRQQVPTIKEPVIDVIDLSPNASPDMAYAGNMKLMAQVMAGEIDVFILDKNSFMKFAAEGWFKSLDALAAEIGIDTEKNSPYKLEIEENAGLHQYGIDVGESPLLNNTNFVGNEKIVAICIKTGNPEKSEAFVKALLKK